MPLRIMMVAVGLLVVPFAMPTVVLLFVALLPTVVAAFAEKGNTRLAWLCVGGLNFAGCSPYLFKLWFHGHTMSLAFDILGDVSALLIMWAAAAFGWMIYTLMPPVAASVLQMNAQRRVMSLRASQKKLVEQWGDEVKPKAKTDDDDSDQRTRKYDLMK